MTPPMIWFPTVTPFASDTPCFPAAIPGAAGTRRGVTHSTVGGGDTGAQNKAGEAGKHPIWRAVETPEICGVYSEDHEKALMGLVRQAAARLGLQLTLSTERWGGTLEQAGWHGPLISSRRPGAR